MSECRGRFGFSNGAWDAAAVRGDVARRPDRRRIRAGTTRRAVEDGLAAGRSQSAIARALDVSPATVAYHARGLGYPVDARCARRYDWDEVQRHYDAGNSLRACRDRFGFGSRTWHEAVRRGAVVPRPAAAPLEIYLVSNRPTSRGHLKARLLASGLKHACCEACGIDSWLGRPLSLALHHVNGVQHDNRLENLALLSPNCHSQTENFAGRNAGGGTRLRQSARSPTPPRSPA